MDRCKNCIPNRKSKNHQVCLVTISGRPESFYQHKARSSNAVRKKCYVRGCRCINPEPEVKK